MICYGELEPSLRRLGASRLRQLWRHALDKKGNPFAEAGLTPGECLLLWTAAVLAARNLLSPDQQSAVIEEFSFDIRRLGDDLGKKIAELSNKETPIRGRLPVHLLTILDCGLVRLGGQPDYFDIKTAKRVPLLPRPPIEFLNIDLTALYTRFFLDLGTATAKGE
jgi:hypothetical protein